LNRASFEKVLGDLVASFAVTQWPVQGVILNFVHSVHVAQAFAFEKGFLVGKPTGAAHDNRTRNSRP
jgi:hypothetical protein